jgi:hypothetical protein
MFFNKCRCRLRWCTLIVLIFSALAAADKNEDNTSEEREESSSEDEQNTEPSTTPDSTYFIYKRPPAGLFPHEVHQAVALGGNYATATSLVPPQAPTSHYVRANGNVPPALPLSSPYRPLPESPLFYGGVTGNPQDVATEKSSMRKSRKNHQKRNKRNKNKRNKNKFKSVIPNDTILDFYNTFVNKDDSGERGPRQSEFAEYNDYDYGGQTFSNSDPVLQGGQVPPFAASANSFSQSINPFQSSSGDQYGAPQSPVVSNDEYGAPQAPVSSSYGSYAPAPAPGSKLA